MKTCNIPIVEDTVQCLNVKVYKKYTLALLFACNTCVYSWSNKIQFYESLLPGLQWLWSSTSIYEITVHEVFNEMMNVHNDETMIIHKLNKLINKWNAQLFILDYLIPAACLLLLFIFDMMIWNIFKATCPFYRHEKKAQYENNCCKKYPCNCITPEISHLPTTSFCLVTIFVMS